MAARRRKPPPSAAARERARQERDQVAAEFADLPLDLGVTMGRVPKPIEAIAAFDAGKVFVGADDMGAPKRSTYATPAPATGAPDWMSAGDMPWERAGRPDVAIGYLNTLNGGPTMGEQARSEVVGTEADIEAARAGAPQQPPGPAEAPGLDLSKLTFVPGSSSQYQTGAQFAPETEQSLASSRGEAFEAARLASESKVKFATLAAKAYGPDADYQARLTQLDAQQKRVEADRARMRAEFDGALAAAQNAEPDRDRWWSSRSTGQKVALTIASLFGARAQALSGGKIENAAEEYIKREIDADVTSQERMLARSERQQGTRLNMLGLLQQELGGIDAAKATLRALQADEVARRLKEAEYGSSDPLIRGQLHQARAVAENTHAKLLMRRDEAASGRSTSGTQTPPMYKLPDGTLVTAQMLAAQIKASKPKEAAEVKDYIKVQFSKDYRPVRAGAQLLQRMEAVKEMGITPASSLIGAIRAKFGGKDPVGSLKAQLSLYAVQAARESGGERGVTTESEWPRIEAAIQGNDWNKFEASVNNIKREVYNAHIELVRRLNAFPDSDMQRSFAWMREDPIKLLSQGKDFKRVTD